MRPIVPRLWKQKAEKIFTDICLPEGKKAGLREGGALRNFRNEMRRVAGYSD